MQKYKIVPFAYIELCFVFIIDYIQQRLFQHTLAHLPMCRIVSIGTLVQKGSILVEVALVIYFVGFVPGHNNVDD